ncbi:MAG: ECF-type sigma factor, partial [Isosphaeraceae bacterium]
KRGKRWTRHPVEMALDRLETDHGIPALEFQEILNELKAIDPRKALIASLHGILQMTHQEIAASLEISLSTVEREWRLARAWLKDRLTDQDR